MCTCAKNRGKNELDCSDEFKHMINSECEMSCTYREFWKVAETPIEDTSTIQDILEEMKDVIHEIVLKNFIKNEEWNEFKT